MIDQFVGFCLHRRVAVIMLAVLLAAFGVYAWETLSVEAYPELGDVAAQVTTQMPGLAAEEVEQLITVPLEREINGTPGPAADALVQHLRAVADHGAVPRRLRGLLGAAAVDRTHQPGGAAGRRDAVARSGGRARAARSTATRWSPTRKNLQELSEIQRWIGDSGAQVGPGRGR